VPALVPTAEGGAPAGVPAAPAAAAAAAPAPAPITPAGQGAPGLPTDQASGPTGRLAISSARIAGNEVLIGLVATAEVARGQRYRIEREGRTRVLAVVFRVEGNQAWATAIASTWAPDAGDRTVLTTDSAVLDR
jgi:hypothetical protein